MESRWRLINKTLCLCIVIIVLVTPFSAGFVSGAEEKDEPKPKVLVIYTSRDGEMDKYQRSLDMLVSHFTSDVTFISSSEVQKQDLTSVTHLIYFGQVSAKLPPSFLTMFDDYQRTVIAIGYNSEQLGDRFSFVHPGHEVSINRLYLTDSVDRIMETTEESNIIQIAPDKGTEVLLAGKMSGEAAVYPTGVRNGNHYYFAIDSLNMQKTILIGELFYEAFGKKQDTVHSGYIRLEDVNPLTPHEPLREIATLLKEKNIPYLVAVIPIHIDPETGKEHTFADSPELLKVLRGIQEDQGSIVMHGYTHQFRSSEMGEGFEFWDVENNTPIYSDGSLDFKLRKEKEFHSKAEYDRYISGLQTFEREYIETKLNKGIEELTKYGLYPLAFEAPHYTMSQNGYKVVSQYFSTYVGQLQLSDKNWKAMGTSPYITTPSMLNGMKLLPETLGYVDSENPHAMEDIWAKAENIAWTKSGIYAVFYHPYLGSGGFVELLQQLEQIPNISWIDLKQMDGVWVKNDKIFIQADNGSIIVDADFGKKSNTLLTVSKIYVKDVIDIVLWVMAVIGGAAVLVFILNTIYLKLSNENQVGE
ncbi:DUF2334 domain-containing protein [Peribacillus asahii]|uniref:DUF2334 domain-containing protein n=1 Tax=Peribacillus asahii TaxID=228899 RepID=UPI00381B0805